MVTRTLLAFVLAAGVGMPAHAQTIDEAINAGMAQSNQRAAEAAAAIRASQPKVDAAAAANKEEFRTVAEAAKKIQVDALREKFQHGQGQPGGPGAHGDPTHIAQTDAILVFVSSAMSPTDFRGALDASASDKRVHLILRGIPPGTDIAKFQEWLRPWLAPYVDGDVPNIEINPPMWAKFGVDTAPTAIVTHNGQEVARVGGVFSPTWLDAELKRRKGDLGVFGAVVSPNEIDPIAEVNKRAAAFDWAGYKKKLVDNYWSTAKLPDVPLATKSAVRMLDPSIVVTKTIALPDGRVIVREGQRLNPLAVAPLTPTILVVDSRDAKSRAWAAAQVSQIGDRGVMVLSSSTPTDEDGWAEWARWSRQMGAPLYTYTPALAQKLQLTGVPARITQVGEQLKVEQFDHDNLAEDTSKVAKNARTNLSAR